MDLISSFYFIRTKSKIFIKVLVIDIVEDINMLFEFIIVFELIGVIF